LLTFTLVSVLTIFVPVVAIILGFDSVNGEHNRRTMSRILAQPIYRDALLFGKFLAGLFTLSITMVTLWLLVIGFGLFFLGVAPNSEEIARAFIFLLVVIVYAGVWLALAMLFSIIFRSVVTAVLAAFGLWFFLMIIWPTLAPAIVVGLLPTNDEETLILAAQYLSRVSPSTLFGEVVLAILNPTTRSLGPIYFSQLQGAVLGAPMPLGESLIIAWPEIVGLIASNIILFVTGYVIFQRQEVRA
jgi:ABC-2 type transport system permease protein